MTILTRNAVPAVTPEGFLPGSTLDRRAPDMAVRFAASSYDASARTVEAVLTTGARVRRWGIFEELAVTPEAVDLGRASAGQVRLLDSHRQDTIDAVLGVVENVRFEGERLLGRLRFSDTDAGRRAEAMVAAGDLTGVSIGYRVSTWTMAQVENDVEVWRADRWELLEASLVAVPADPAARTRAAAMPEPPNPETETDDMRRNAPTGAEPAIPVTNPTEPAVRAAPQAPAQPDTAAAVRAERARVRELTDIATRAGIPADRLSDAIDNGEGVEAFRAAAFDHLAARQRPASHVRVERDETETRREAMEEAVIRGINPAWVQGEPSAAAREFMGLSLVEMAAIRLGERRVPFDYAGRERIIQRAMHTTSDFPILLENALNRGLTASYDLARPTYRDIAVREDFNDFRPHDSVTVGDFPLPQPIAEAGKIVFGTVGEKKETVAVLPYAIGLSISRQLMVNDSLSGLDRVLASYGQSVALFEERTFYQMKALNSGNGPTLLEGNTAMFAAARGNLAGTGGAINVTTVGAARAAMRGYRTIPSGRAGDTGNELLFNAPSIILVGPAQETAAEQFVTTIQPNARSEVNPFQGRLSVLVSQMITGNRWELYTAPSVRANFRWGLLRGYAAPRVRIDEPFGTQGTQLSVEHDFGVGGIDWRAAYANPGQ